MFSSVNILGAHNHKKYKTGGSNNLTNTLF